MKAVTNRIKEQRQCHMCPAGVWWPAVALDFDHVRGIKHKNVSTLVQRAGRKTVLEEVAKCDVLCASHHRIVTALRAGKDPSAGVKP